MKFKAQILAATIAASFMFAGGVEACSDAAWTGGNTGSAVVGQSILGSSPASTVIGVKRYSGKCGMKPAAGDGASFVTDNNPAAESVYRARMYVFTGSPTAPVKFFRATDADDNGGNEVISINFDGSAFNFNVGGSTGAISGIAPNKWYSVEFVHAVGKPFNAEVQGAKREADAATAAPLTVTGTGNSAGSVASASFGVIEAAAGASTMSFDQFDSTRNETTKIGRLCRGDANGSGGAINVFDKILVTSELNNVSPASGQPDANEDGNINVFDNIEVVRMINFAVTCP